MLTEKRHEQILKLLEERGSITVAEAKEILGTSESTIRRDITVLDREAGESVWRRGVFRPERGVGI